MRLQDQLRSLHPASSHRTLKQWLEGGRVRVNNQIVRRGDVPVTPEDRIELAAATARFPPLLRLVYEDADLVVVDKPAGLLTIATERERERTAYRMLSDYVAGGPASARAARSSAPRSKPRPFLFIVHRLDRETSGLLVLAKTALAKQRLQYQFKARAVERVYVAVVEGQVRGTTGVLRGRLIEDRAFRVRLTRNPHMGKEAVTHYRVIGRGRATTLLELRLSTGRRGQLRAQLAARGHPIVGDTLYGSRTNPLRRICLHATRLGFIHPGGDPVRFDSPVPAAFLRV